MVSVALTALVGFFSLGVYRANIEIEKGPRPPLSETIEGRVIKETYEKASSGFGRDTHNAVVQTPEGRMINIASYQIFARQINNMVDEGDTVRLNLSRKFPREHTGSPSFYEILTADILSVQKKGQ
ncbi:MAG: hypothetical protein Q8Q31_01550 [Nanoarchaeota archaeon]|nr:hypothetical protein [Nanoarchaeota archaeon]